MTRYVHMTVLAVRYESRRRFRPDREGTTTGGSRTMRMQEIRERIERDEYEVDAQKVADAILRRHCLGRHGGRPSGKRAGRTEARASKFVAAPPRG
jgi:hypothetical protein